MPDTAINLYSVRALDESLLAVLDRVAAAGYDGVQFAGLGSASPLAVAEKLAATGLTAIPPHVDASRLGGDPDAVVEEYAPLDVDGFVVPHLGEEHFADRGAVAATAERLDALAATFADRGYDLHYHNHAHEFTDLGDETGYEALVEATDRVRFEVDVGWALVGGTDPAALLRRLEGRVDLVHMKDMAVDAVGDGFREIGTGDVDVAACAAAAREVGASWLVYEHDDPEDPAASIETGADVLADL